MKGYGMLAGLYLKQQRRRSALTILGIVLSVALITALLTMGQASKDNVLKQQIYENGGFHFSYPNADGALYDKLRSHALVDRVGVRMQNGTETALDETYKVYVQAANQDALHLLPIHVAHGRMPSTPDEIAAEEWVVQRMPSKPQLGNTVTLNDPHGKPHPYQLVGILKNDTYSQVYRASTAFTLLSDSARLLPSDHMELFVTLKAGVHISSHLEEFQKMSKVFMANNQVLAYMGESSDSGLNRALMVIFGTLVGLVVLSTIAVIYNAFHISVLERIRQFGLLRTIGATPRQIRNLVFREASMLAVIGIPLGLGIGWGGLWLALWFMIQGGLNILQMDDFQLTFHWWIMGVSVMVGIAAVYMAAWLPARKASRVSPVDAVRGAGSIARESYRKMRIPSLLRLLGIEGKMASNNIRRNKTKFRITTFSIVISVMLFIVFHFFTQQMFKLTVDTTESNKIAFELSRFINPEKNVKDAAKKITDIVSPETKNRIASLPGVDDVYGRYEEPAAFALVPSNLVNPEFSRISGIQFEEADMKSQKSRLVNADLQLYDDTRLGKAPQFLKSGSADRAKLEAEDGVLIVQTVKARDSATKKNKIMELTKYKVGDTITIQMGQNTKDPKTTRQVKVVGILSQSPFDGAYRPDSLTVVATKKTMQKLMEALPPAQYPYGTTMLSLQIALKDGADSEPVRIALEQIAADIPGGQLINIVDQQKKDRQFAVQMKIFVYGFLAVIGLIGSLNIINTVQTNLLLRRREIGLLQAVGMTMGQIRKMATAEGVWFGVIGSFWGLLLGGGFSYFLYSQLQGIEGFPFTFPYGGAAIACAFALGIGLLSVQGPLRRMAKANLIEELRDDA